MTDKLTQEVQSIVDDILKQKSDAEMLKETEDALNKSAEKIDELAKSLEAKDGELSVNVEKVSELEKVVAELSGKTKEFEANLEQVKKGFEAEKTELVKRAEMAEAELSNLKKDMKAKTRMEELKAEGVAISDEKALKEQFAKIRDMEDEVFVAYKAERVELRKAIVAELEASTQTKVDDAKVGDTTDKKEDQATDKTVTDDKKEDVTAQLEDEKAAADSGNSIDPMKAVAAMLNMEVIPTGETTAKYKELGKALAERVKSRRAKAQSK